MTEKNKKQSLISSPTQVFAKGHFRANGYSTRMNFVYDKKAARSGRLKEWNFYQIQCGDAVLQLTIGHISYAGQISANLFDIKTGERHSFSKTIFNVAKLKKRMDENPEKPSLLQWFDRKVKMQFEVTPRYRRLTVTQLKGKDIRTEVDVTLTNASFAKDKMVIAVPFEDAKMWYLNYKENCFAANGYCRIDGKEVYIRDGAAVLDWGRGVWPRKHSWVWGNGSTIVDGKHFGFNIGWGFGASETTENMFFYDNVAYKLGKVSETKTANGFRYADEDRNFVFDVVSLYDNFTQTRRLFVNNSCHQVFGTWRGTVKLPDNTKIKIPPFTAFCEHAENNW